MGRLIVLVGVCLIIIGALITFNVPLDWIGNLPGDLYMNWGETMVAVPITTSIIFSFFLAALFFLFSRH